MAKKPPVNNDVNDEENVDSASNATGDKPITAAKVEKLWDEGRTDIAPQTMQYWMNLAFYLGVQWIWYDYSNRLISPVVDSVEKQRERATINKIESAVQHAVAVLMKTPTTFEVLEDSPDDYVRTGALKGEQILRSTAHDNDWEETKEEWLIALILGGTAGVADVWDADANQYSTDIKTGEPKLRTLSIDDFIVEPGANKAKTARWWIHRQVLPAEEVQTMFNLPRKPPEDGIDGGPWSEKAMQFNNKLAQRRGTMVLWYYERPNRLQPQGQICAVVNHKMVFGSGKQDGRNGTFKQASTWNSIFPYRNRLNINVGRVLPLPNKWYGETFVTQAISPQRQINQIWTKLHENTHKTMGAKLLIDQRHIEITKKLNDNPQDVITTAPVDGAPDPHYLDPPKIAPYVMQQLEQLNEELDNIMGTHAISRGETPQNSPDSGYGLNVLSENDTTPTGRIAKELARVWAGVASNVLELFAAKVTDTREASIIMSRGRSMPVKWTGKELAGQTRVVVPPDSVLPQSEAGRLDLAKSILQMRPDWFTSFSQFAKLAFSTGFDGFEDTMDDSATSAEYENYLMSQGTVCQVEEYDNDSAHIQAHQHYQRSREYRILPDMTRKIIQAHIDAHRSAATFKAGQQQFLTSSHPALGAAMAQANGVHPVTGLPGMPSPGGAMPPGAPQDQAGPGLPPTGE